MTGRLWVKIPSFMIRNPKNIGFCAKFLLVWSPRSPFLSLAPTHPSGTECSPLILLIIFWDNCFSSQTTTRWEEVVCNLNIEKVDLIPSDFWIWEHFVFDKFILSLRRRSAGLDTLWSALCKMVQQISSSLFCQILARNQSNNTCDQQLTAFSGCYLHLSFPKI